MKGYDEYNTILLPPRGAGSDLPKELIEAFHEMSKKKVEQDGQNVTGENGVIELNENEEEAENQDANAAEKKFDDVASEEDVESDHDAGKSVLMIIVALPGNFTFQCLKITLK